MIPTAELSVVSRLVVIAHSGSLNKIEMPCQARKHCHLGFEKRELRHSNRAHSAWRQRPFSSRTDLKVFRAELAAGIPP
jgi:hypothetical protein